MAATWDKDLLHAEGNVIGDEARAKYNQAQRQGNHGRYFGLTFWSPNINIFRDPRWGRGQETYGEDPFLTGTLATQFVRGIAGRRSALSDGRCDGEAFRRAQRAGADAPQRSTSIRRRRTSARPICRHSGGRSWTARRRS